MKTLVRLTLVEAKLSLRDVTPPLFSLVLPVALLLIFGSFEDARQPNAALGGSRRLDTTVPSMAMVVSTAMLAFFMLPGALAIYRGKGVLRRLATTPVRSAALLAAQLLMNLATAVVGVVVLVLVGASQLGMRPPHLLLLPTFLGGVTGLFAIGLLIAAVVPNIKVAQIFSFAVFLPSAFFAGVYLPKENMPPLLSRVADYTPLGAFREAVQDAWTGQVPQLTHVLVLATTAVVASALAVRLYRQDAT